MSESKDQPEGAQDQGQFVHTFIPKPGTLHPPVPAEDGLCRICGLSVDHAVHQVTKPLDPQKQHTEQPGRENTPEQVNVRPLVKDISGALDKLITRVANMRIDLAEVVGHLQAIDRCLSGEHAYEHGLMNEGYEVYQDPPCVVLRREIRRLKAML